MKIREFMKIYALELSIIIILLISIILLMRVMSFVKNEKAFQRSMMNDCIEAGIDEKLCKKMALDVWTR